MEGWNMELEDYMEKRQIFLGGRACGQINAISTFHGEELYWETELVRKLMQLVDSMKKDKLSWETELVLIDDKNLSKGSI